MPTRSGNPVRSNRFRSRAQDNSGYQGYTSVSVCSCRSRLLVEISHRSRSFRPASGAYAGKIRNDSLGQFNVIPATMIYHVQDVTIISLIAAAFNAFCGAAPPSLSIAANDELW